MRRNEPVTQREKNYPSDSNLISTTDLKGQIRYANEDFCKVSGYTSEELHGRPHNLIRHPDMPPAAFADLWKTIQGGQSWMGIVKNRCKNGDHYWVDAFVSPIRAGDHTTEYQSVRTKPDPKVVARAEKLYQSLNQDRQPRQLKGPRLSFKARLSLYASLASLPLALYTAAQLATPVAFFLGLLACTLIGAAVWLGARPLDGAVQEARQIVQNPLMQLVYTGRTDEIGQLQLALKMYRSQLRAVVGRVLDASHLAECAAERSSEVGTRASRNIESQQQQLEQLSVALHEVSTTVQDMARNSSLTADATQRTLEISKEGQQVIADSVVAIQNLTALLEQVADQIHQLSEQSSRIDEVIHVIDGIAGQTNLLALNAAIEAARAGEQGRGFAVVADEVRALAQRTQNSTVEIQSIIHAIQDNIRQAVTGIQEGGSLSTDCLRLSEAAQESFQAMTSQVTTTTDMNLQIASAIEEQSYVLEDISRKIAQLNETARSNAGIAEKSSALCTQVARQLAQLLRLIEQFQQRTA